MRNHLKSDWWTQVQSQIHPHVSVYFSSLQVSLDNLTWWTIIEVQGNQAGAQARSLDRLLL